MKIAIYEPDPRICGPDSWAQALKAGFIALGHTVHTVSFTKSGKPRAKWGRVVQWESSSSSCKMTIDKCAAIDDAGDLLDQYDLIVLTDVKTPTHDKPAFKEGLLYPEYIEVLMQTSTPFTSALHGKWQFLEWETPQGMTAVQGSPFLDTLVGLDNFSGFLLRHGDHFMEHTDALDDVDTELMPLPFVPHAVLDLSLKNRRTMATLGRVIPTKHRCFLNYVIDSLMSNVDCVYAGGCGLANGPSYTFVTFEQLLEFGWDGVWNGEPISYDEADCIVLHNSGTRSTKPWVATSKDRRVEYRGAYFEPADVLYDAVVHVGITCSRFSGGLLEFSTLEAIDCGLLPIVSRPFVPDAGGDFHLEVIEHAFVGSPVPKSVPRIPELERISTLTHNAIERAFSAWHVELVKHNRHVLTTHHDPKRHAKLFIERAL